MGTGVQRGAVLLLLGATILGCTRGHPRDQRPLMIVPDMEFQRKFLPQGHTPLFEDHRTMRTPPRGTVARGTFRENTAYYEGRVYPSSAETVFVAHNPREITEQLLRRGQERFSVYCAPCHDRTGGGKGIVTGYGLVPPPTFHQDRIRSLSDGQIFDLIRNGIRTMPAYGAQIPAEDRWAIVAYFRALQRSQYATLSDVPEDERDRLR
jgi:mono/diheme cytochrome c family protein